MALIEKLTAIANAIRSKTGKTEGLTLEQMPGEIEEIETGGSGGNPSYTGEICSMFAERVVIGANTVTNAKLVNEYFTSICKGDVLIGIALTTVPNSQNQFIYWSDAGNGYIFYRFRDNKINAASGWNNGGYDAMLIDGTEYVVLSGTAPNVV